MSTKRILSLVLALVMVLGTFGTVFADGTGSEKIDWLVKQEMIKGDQSGDLKLDSKIDRASTARMIAVALGLESEAESLKLINSGFKDMTTAHWANGYANLAAGKNLIVGDAKGNFMPAKDITNGEVLAILVRLSLGRDLTAEERGNAGSWVAPYIAKASELGVTDGVNITDVNAAAIRKDVFEMFYNVITGKQHGKYDIYKAIVLENHRVQKLNKDEILVEIIKEIKKADYVKESREEKGDQISLTVPADVADVEDLLGKVADFTVTKDGKVVEVKVDESYKVETGSFKATRNKMGSYTVDLPERYSKSDETIFRTYYNNNPYKYEEFYTTPDAKRGEETTEFKVDYARVTVKNGKVLLINAFNFEDIAPVKELNEKKDQVVVYDDVRDGRTKVYEKKDIKNVIFVENDKFSVGSFDEIEANDVIHEHKNGFLVRKDASVNGEFKKVSETRDGDVQVYIDDKAFTVSAVDNKKPVYQFEKDAKFYTLVARDAHNQLKDFRGEKATALIDLGNKLQYVGSEVDLGEFVGVVTKVVGKDVRILKPDNKTEDYTATLSTKVNSYSTGHQGLNQLNAGDLVYVRASGTELEVINKIDDTSKTVNSVDSKYIKFTDKTEKRMLDDTVIFVVIKDEKGNLDYAEVRTVGDVKDALEKDVDKAYVLNGKEHEEIARTRTSGINRENEAHTIVFTKIDIKPDVKGEIAKFVGFDDRQETLMNVEFANRSEKTIKIARGTDLPKDLRIGDIISYEITKEKEEKDRTVTKVEVVIAKDSKVIYEVKDADAYGTIKLSNGKTYYENSKTESFGGSLRTGDKVSIYHGKDDNYLLATLKRDKDAVVGGGDTTDSGIVTYKNATSSIIIVDGKTYTANKDTIVNGVDGKPLSAGDFVGLTEGDKVDIKGDRFNITYSVKIEAAKVDALIEAFSTPATKAEVTAARAAYDKLTTAQKALVKPVNVTALTNAENALAGTLVQELIDALPAKANVKLADKAQVEAARAAYNKLTPAQATGLVLTKLTEAEAMITAWENVAEAKADLKLTVTKVSDTNYTIAEPSNHTNGAKHVLAVGTLPTFEDTGAVTGTSPVDITKDSKAFTFELTVTITDGTEASATENVVFVVTVPNTLEAVTIAVK
ncbi:S-layer homology domain-containing protein [uncultured Tissierella sp.]|uniref:S-layer homology domain-containing protein n=1 Tax=uncultured Tissierella sp. TaxID=448160 RepID=UPI0028048DC5|nr:S-layer homology domain-containing protein [uncultured Tissierella sp.]